MLEVGAARHRRLGMRGGLRHERGRQVEQAERDVAGAVAQVHPVQGRDLVVAGAARAQPAAEVGAGPLDQPPLQGGVHVLVGRGWARRHRGRRRPRAGRARRAGRRAGRPSAGRPRAGRARERATRRGRTGRAPSRTAPTPTVRRGRPPGRSRTGPPHRLRASGGADGAFAVTASPRSRSTLINADCMIDAVA